MNTQSGVPQKQSEAQSKASQQAPEGKAEASNKPAGRTYTQAEYDTMQSKKDKEISSERALRRAAESRVPDFEETIESLKDKVVSLQSQVDEGIPDDVKEYREKLSKKEAELGKRDREWKRERREWDEALAKANEEKKSSLAETLAKEFGIDVDALLALESQEEMKVYAVDHRDSSKIQTSKEEVLKNPDPLIPMNTPSGDWHEKYRNGQISTEDLISQGVRESKPREKRT
jgi:hypothetical protein